MNVSGRGSERVKRLVQKVGGDAYLTGHGAAKYLDHYSFESAKIAVHYMRYENYHWQQFGDQFTPFVTGLDLVAMLTKIHVLNIWSNNLMTGENSYEQRKIRPRKFS